jgi:predicted ATPase/DNA-binding SARP family transcriptional activator
MNHLSISLLGSTRFSINGVEIKMPTSRAIPLFAYLAITRISQSRQTLASLLWSESNLPHALGSLRTTLWRLNSTGLGNWIIQDHGEISLDFNKSIDVDVLEFMKLVHQCTTHGHPASQVCLSCIPLLTDAIALYHGEFLSSNHIANAYGFEEWRFRESEILHISFLEILEKLVHGHRIFGNFNLAIHYSRLWLSQDQYNETAQHDLLQLYSITGQRAAAINQYKRYKRLILQELGIEPSEEISSLYKQILSGRFTPSASRKTKSPVILTADFESAASYWSQPGINKTLLLQKYLKILTETCKQFGGHILQDSEDNVTMLFEYGQPLHFAITIHQKLNKTNWDGTNPPDVRMVIYSIARENGHNDNFSTRVRAASNLLTISWGGQILITEQALRELDLPPGSRFKDLGYHVLDETMQAIHVYEVVHPYIPAVDHPLLKSVSPKLVNLPSFTSSFIGRQEEISKLFNLFSIPENRIVSLVGPGGTGKTRLAVQFATQIAGQFSDGVFYISLSSIQDPDLIPIILADILKFNYFGSKSHIEQLCDYLQRMKALFIFDNFEHLRLKGTLFLVDLINQTQAIKILVTTRERLNLISESYMEIRGLPVPPSEKADHTESYSSIELFLNTAQRISPGLKFADNSASIIQICKLVNGLPLGIILASSWVRRYSCQQISEEISKNIDFLATTAPDIAPRHRSLRAVFDNSWQLLTDEERLILSRLSIFQSAFSIHAAQEICFATPFLLASLVDKSLLYRRQDDRYEILDTFHQYAHEKLKSRHDEISTIISRFCEYFANFCSQKQLELNSPLQHQAMIDMTDEIESIRTAWAWMVDTNRWDLIGKAKDILLAYHVIQGNFVQGRNFFHIALQKLDSSKTPSLDLVRASMLQLDSWMTFRNGYSIEGITGLVESMDIFKRCNSQWDIAMTSFFLGEIQRSLGNSQHAEIYIREAIQILIQDSIPKSNYVLAFTAHCQSVLGTILMEQGHFESARNLLESSLSAQLQLGTSFGTIHPTMGLAKMAYLLGDVAMARDIYLQALETATRIDDRRNMATIHNNLGDLEQEMANPSDAHLHLLSALQLCSETGDRRLTAIILNNLAYYQLKHLQNPSEALHSYQQSIALFCELGDMRGATYTYYDISKAYLQIGLMAEAREYCLRSLQTAITLDNVSLVLHATQGFANLYAKSGAPERALSLCKLIENHPQIESDTQKRVMVTRGELEATLAPEVVENASKWTQSIDLQEAIHILLKENSGSQQIHYR